MYSKYNPAKSKGKYNKKEKNSGIIQKAYMKSLTIVVCNDYESVQVKIYKKHLSSFLIILV
jgi:hypothetical protein